MSPEQALMIEQLRYLQNGVTLKMSSSLVEALTTAFNDAAAFATQVDEASKRDDATDELKRLAPDIVVKRRHSLTMLYQTLNQSIVEQYPVVGANLAARNQAEQAKLEASANVEANSFLDKLRKGI